MLCLDGHCAGRQQGGRGTRNEGHENRTGMLEPTDGPVAIGEGSICRWEPEPQPPPCCSPAACPAPGQRLMHQDRVSPLSQAGRKPAGLSQEQETFSKNHLWPAVSSWLWEGAGGTCPGASRGRQAGHHGHSRTGLGCPLPPQHLQPQKQVNEQ